MSSCNSVVKELIQAIAQHKERLVVIFWEVMLRYKFITWPANFNTACSSVSLERQLKTRLALLLAVKGYSLSHRYIRPTRWNRKDGARNDPMNQDILPHPPRECSCGMKLEGVFMTTTHFSNSDNTPCQTYITFKWYHKINLIYYILS
jgi:hypothetical protein